MSRMRPGRPARASFARAAAVALGLALPLLGGSTPDARGQEVTAADVATARDLFIQASALGQQNKWDEARALYERSLALKRAPVTLYSLGAAQKHSGRWVEAIESFRAFLAEPSTAGTRAYEEPARKAVAELSPRLAHVTIVLPSGAGSDARVELDGQLVASAALGTARPVNPGAHVIAVTAPGRKPLRREITVREGERTNVELVLEIEAPAPSSTPVATAAPSASPAPAVVSAAVVATALSVRPSTTAAPVSPPVDPSPSRVLPIGLLAAGGAVLIGGVVVGLVGVAHASDASTRSGPAADRARAEALAGDVLAGIGLAACAAGGIVLLVRSRAPSAPSASLVLGPATLDLRGRF